MLKLEQIYHVESEKWLGGLLHANDELVQALMTFEQLDRSIDADSDSDDDIAEQAHLYRSKSPATLLCLLWTTADRCQWQPNAQRAKSLLHRLPHPLPIPWLT